MKHISVLIPEGETSLSNIEACHKMFTKVNEAVERAGMAPVFRVQLVGLSKETKLAHGLFTVKPDLTLDEVTRTDLIIIPAVHGDVSRVLELNKAFIPWITERYTQGTEVCSLCIGAFILASTGLLNGRSCTTHWLMAEEFARLFPQVNLMPYKIITDENGIYTSGGAYSSLNLILYLVEKYAGRDMALLSSKIFEIEIDRKSQSPFMIFKGQKEHEDDAIRKVQDYIEEHFPEKINVDQLAGMIALGRRTFERRFKTATGNTVTEYIQRVKIEAAKKGFETSRRNINEIMYDVGYNDTKAFRSIFRKITGLSPVEYRNKYNKMPVA